MELTLLSSVNLLDRAFHPARHPLPGLPKLHNKRSAHNEYRIGLTAPQSVDFS